MAKPDGELIRVWRDLAEEGYLYAEISRMHPPFSVDQVRHYCLGHTGYKIVGPIQKVDRRYGSNVWLRGADSPHAELTEKQARRVLDDWDEKADKWKKSGADWARKLGVSPSTIYRLRRGETWKFLEHPNQGRKPKKSRRMAKPDGRAGEVSAQPHTPKTVDNAQALGDRLKDLVRANPDGVTDEQLSELSEFVSGLVSVSHDRPLATASVQDGESEDSLGALHRVNPSPSRPSSQAAHDRLLDIQIRNQQRTFNARATAACFVVSAVCLFLGVLVAIQFLWVAIVLFFLASRGYKTFVEDVSDRPEDGWR